MASSYPGALDNLRADYAGTDQADVVDHAGMHNDERDAINALQAELGTNPSGAASTVRARIEALEENYELAEGPAGAPGGSDEAFAAWLDDEGSATRGKLDEIAVAKAESPRGGQRPRLARRPTLTVDQVWPNAIADVRLVHADGPVLYAVGSDTVLRKSSDQGITWTKRWYPGGLGVLAKAGLFLKTAAGSLLTTYHPFDLSAPKIMRSTDDGATWSDVVAAQTGIDYLGPTSIAQDPLTGYLYLSEYVTATAATKPTWKISRSTDDGATWSTFHTFQRDAATYPTTAVRHGHAIQWDPVDAKMWFLCGDGEQAAGLYRLTTDGTGIEPVIIKSQLPTNIYAGAVGIMFFPNYIAWGNDQRADSGLLRVARSDLGSPTPTVELVAQLQATSFYTARTKADNSEWLLTVSNEDGGGGRLDNAFHVYRVADDAATVDEVLTIPASLDDGSFAWVYPVAGASPLGDGTPVWLTVGSSSPVMPSTGDPTVYSLRARLTWGGQSLVRPDATLRRPHYEPVSASSGFVSLIAQQSRIFAVTEAPVRATRLYILETTREQLAGAGFPYVEVCTYTQGALNQTLGTGLTVDAPGDAIAKTAHGLTVGTPVRFSAISGVVGLTAGVTYYVSVASPDFFSVSATLGGPTVDITTGGTVTVAYDPLPVMTLLLAEDGSTMQWQNRSRKSALNEAGAPWIMRSGLILPGTKLCFRVRNPTGSTADVVAGITYAWGF